VNASALILPERPDKPRRNGLTMMVDGGLPSRHFADLVASGAEYLDLVKFGWGTAIVTNDLEAKIAVLKEHGVTYYFGGTLFEKFVLQDHFDEFRYFCQRYACTHVEVSNGTIPLGNTAKCGYIRKLADDFTVISEVGFKDPERSEMLPPHLWIDSIREDQDAGADLVTLEARESGRSGICRPDGKLRYGLIEELLDSDIDVRSLLFEAPTTELQSFFVTRVGPNVNLGNVAATALIGLETLRLGLRADTLMTFDEAI